MELKIVNSILLTNFVKWTETYVIFRNYKNML